MLTHVRSNVPIEVIVCVTILTTFVWLASCESEDAPKDSDGVPICDPVADFADASVAYDIGEWSSSNCEQVGIRIEITQMLHSSDFRHFEVFGSVSGASGSLYLFALSADNGSLCYSQIESGEFYAAVGFDACVDLVDFIVLNAPPSNLTLLGEKEKIVCQFGFNLDPPDCEPQPAGEDD